MLFEKTKKELEAKKASDETKKKEREVKEEKQRNAAEQSAALVKAKETAEKEANAAAVAAVAAVVAVEKTEDKPASTEIKVEGEDEDDKGPIPFQNGGTTELYTWTQTLDELHIFLPVKADLRSKFVNVEFKLKHLKVVIEGKTIIDKDFTENINV